jgi:hypothetical protein
VDALPKVIAFTSLQEFNLSYEFLVGPQPARLTPHRIGRLLLQVTGPPAPGDIQRRSHGATRALLTLYPHS